MTGPDNRNGPKGPNGPNGRRREWGDCPFGQGGSWHGNGGHSPNALYRNPDKGKIMGVCAGISDYFGIRRGLVRLAFVLGLIFFFAPTLFVYFGLGIFLKPTPEALYRDEQEESFWRDVRVDPERTFSALRHKFKDVEKRLQGLETFVTSREFRLHKEFRDLENES